MGDPAPNRETPRRAEGPAACLEPIRIDPAGGADTHHAGPGECGDVAPEWRGGVRWGRSPSLSRAGGRCQCTVRPEGVRSG